MDLRRLVVCLDGTWNDRNDSTNVLHQFSLVRECTGMPLGKGDTLTQHRFYHEGVGTGPLDRITGGGFGFGLEANVRDAYNWLVQNYRDADPSTGGPADEVYVFGFSRGAYTARSLVGFIAACGLLRRGAPLTVMQLWENYRLLGREHEGHAGPWDRLEQAEFRRISDLVVDPWLLPPGANPHRVPPDELNLTERELVHCSRRVAITYLGVYDTVGAMGWDALAIPGLRSHMAQHHNMRPSTIIQRCHHALAIDEHRSSFRHTPLVAYVGDPRAALEVQRAGGAGGVRAFWQQRIEQRWFVGAHSNIGGGYSNNVLAQAPLRWIFDGARAAGLVCDPPDHPASSAESWPAPRDSYAEFAAPLWAHLVRAKRSYREIDPEPFLMAAPAAGAPAQSHETIGETVDPTVWQFWAATPGEAPPNLLRYQARTGSGPTAQLRSSHAWLDDRLLSQLWLIAWSSFAVLGLAVLDRIFLLFREPSTKLELVSYAIAAALPLFDLLDSRVNWRRAASEREPRFEAYAHVIFWVRAACVALCAAGAAGVLELIWRQGWRAATVGTAIDYLWLTVWPWLGVPAAVAAGVLCAQAIHGALGRRWATTILATAAGYAAVVTALGVVAILAGFAAALTGAQPQPPLDPFAIRDVSHEQIVAGQLLLVQLALAALFMGFGWVGEPLARRNLGSVRQLQMCVSVDAVRSQLASWAARLGAPANPAAPAAMRQALCTALWRDTLGFVPLYGLALVLGLHYAAQTLGWSWLGRAWYLLPLATVVADWIENACHFRYVVLDRRAQNPSLALVVLATFAMFVKLGGFLTGTALMLGAAAGASIDILANPSLHGWRGAVALLVTALPLLFVVAAVAGAIVQTVRDRR